MIRREEGRRGGTSRRAGRPVRKVPRRFTISMQKRLIFMFMLIVASFVFLGFRLFII